MDFNPEARYPVELNEMKSHPFINLGVCGQVSQFKLRECALARGARVKARLLQVLGFGFGFSH